MPFFAEETLQAVRSIPLYEIVRPYVELSRSGQNWRGLSPFSQEKTPSFYVLTDGNFYKCHSTGMAGDGIRFLQEMEKLTFPEAVESLAERFAIPVRFADGAAPDPEQRSKRQALLDIHEYAADYYHRILMGDDPSAEAVRRYWVEERGFPLDVAREFRIGYAPAESRGLLELLQGKGFSNPVLAESGLFHAGRQPDRPDRWFFVFRGRLMVPIRDLQGQVVAFTARQLEQTPRDHDSWKAKYINSPETPLFKKSSLLFNLDRARSAVKEAGRILLVEGQLDALRCWHAGLPETVAPQGTSVTDPQLKLVKRYTDRLEVLLDPDEAGRRAALRLIPIAFQNRLEVRVLELPAGQDPDTFLLEKGRGGVDALEGLSAIAFAVRTLAGEEGDPSPETRARVMESVFKLIAACPNAVVRDGYFEEVVAELKVSPEAARAEFKRLNGAGRSAPEALAATNHGSAGTNPSPTLTNLEADLLWAVLQNVAWIEPLAQVIDHQWIKTNTTEGKILSLLLAHATVDRIEGKDSIYFLLESDQERDCFHQLQADLRPQLDMTSYVNQTVNSIARRFCRERVQRLEEEITRVFLDSGDLDRVRALSAEKNELIRHLSGGFLPPVSLPQD
jgi:DNA primase